MRIRETLKLIAGEWHQETGGVLQQFSNTVQDGESTEKSRREETSYYLNSPTEMML